MATTVHEPPRIQAAREPNRPASDSGNGGWRNVAPAGGDLRKVGDRSPAPGSTGIWVVLFAISMTFAAFTSALVVRQGGSTDWRSFRLPWVLYLDTGILLFSSVSLEIARKRVAAYMGGLRSQVSNPARWLYATLFLGLFFVVGQYAAWMQLRAQGLYLATNPSSSFFYVLTAAHGLHVLGGLAGLVYVIAKLHGSMLRRTTLDFASRYWHFMDALWLYLLLLLWIKF